MFRLVLFFCLAAACLAQRLWTASDTLALKTISDVRPSPDGKTILFSVETADVASNRNIGQLMRVNAAGGDPEALKGAQEGASSPRWSPDGKRVAYIANGG